MFIPTIIIIIIIIIIIVIIIIITILRTTPRNVNSWWFKGSALPGMCY